MGTVGEFQDGDRVLVDLVLTNDRRRGAVIASRFASDTRVSVRLDEPLPPYGGRDVNVPGANVRLDEGGSLEA